MTIEEQIAARYPVLFDESQCRMLKNTRDGLREVMRQRLLKSSNMTYETKEGESKEPIIERDWFGKPIEKKVVQPTAGLYNEGAATPNDGPRVALTDQTVVEQ